MIFFLFCQKISFFIFCPYLYFLAFFEHIKKYKYFNILFFDVFSSIFTCIINRIPGKMTHKVQCQDLYPHIRACHQDIWGHVHVSIIWCLYTTLTPLDGYGRKGHAHIDHPDMSYGLTLKVFPWYVQAHRLILKSLQVQASLTSSWSIPSLPFPHFSKDPCLPGWISPMP